MLEKFLNFFKIANDSPIGDNKDYITHEEKRMYSLFNANFYEKDNIEKLESWLFYNYFDNSKNLTEKKYQLAVLGLVLNQKSVYLASLPLIEDMVKDISQELIDNKETSINLYEVFEVKKDLVDLLFLMQFDINTPRKITGINLIPQLLEEDINNPEKIDIAKKIYKQFSPLGLLGEAITQSKSKIDLLMSLQNSKFTDSDIRVLKNFIKTVTDPSYKKYHNVNVNLTYWESLILNEDKVENLNLFKQLYLNNEDKNSYSMSFFSLASLDGHKNTREDELKYLTKMVECRELDLALGEHPKEQSKKTKRPKL